MDKGMKSLRKFSFIKPRYIVIFASIISLIMVVSSYYEFAENKEEIYHMLEEHANSIVYSIDKSSVNAVFADKEMENVLSTHLLGVAKNVARLDSISNLNHDLLVKIAEENDVFRINVFNKNGEKELSNYIPDSIHLREKGKYFPHDFIKPILNGDQKEIILGLKNARMETGIRYAVAVARTDRRGAIIVNLDAESYLEFRKKIGFEKTISDISEKSGIGYIVLQNDSGILASGKAGADLSKFKDDEFLKKAFLIDSASSRIIDYNSEKVFEIVKPFIVENERMGLFRIGLSMDEISMQENKMLFRGGILTLVIIVITVIVIAVIVSNQNYKMVSEQFNKIQTFTGEILANMSQAVITINKENNIEIFNKKAEEIFYIKAEELTGKNYIHLEKYIKNINSIIIDKLELYNYEFELLINNREDKILSLNSSIIRDNEGNPNAYNFVIDDITEARRAELHKHQNEKLIAMGELASGVAHEVRNPLNSIKMIAQRLEKEYSEKINNEEFNTLSNVLKSEASRVNGIIEQFLRFARPPKLNTVEISSSDFLNELNSICGIIVKEKNINFEIKEFATGELNLDIEQMKQVFINLIRNSTDATGEGGKISISFESQKKKNIFIVSDTGTGVSEKDIGNIFNLYFTTKPNGTGLGLSIVQQVISRHSGNIRVESKPGTGTKFIIELPK